MEISFRGGYNAQNQLELSQPTMWVDSSAVRVNARPLRGPGFEFRLCYVLFPLV